ncbi:hypothetical protein FM038_008075 [Shewanella eurypsychrophilus]|uniref:Uncharacterized protein n=1 Tax=Shewanella eurypsychrophilus TaxID=2593656 RepID=A0ABX6V503_9GAMM|nr:MULTISPECIES: hypothetical protein [Shewanella]QFU22110.1 hypothetical protein FS418_09655 [Shewanella sp. YLB-09]QPG57398.1 hypothetical protein FM038_008075 [Shewanella eurypsychrophilus]
MIVIYNQVSLFELVTSMHLDTGHALSKQQQKYVYKLAKAKKKLQLNQLKMITEQPNLAKLSKRVSKQIKYLGKIQKYQFKLAHIELNPIPESHQDHTKSSSSPSTVINNNAQLTIPASLKSPLDKLIVSELQPLKAQPCGACPALKAGRCQCAIKANSRVSRLN